jgi:hypothetical protein
VIWLPRLRLQIFRKFDGMAAAHYAWSESPQSLPAPAHRTRERRRTKRHTHQTKFACGQEQAVSLRQELIDAVGSQKIEHLARKEAVKAVVRLMYAWGTVTLIDTSAF